MYLTILLTGGGSAIPGFKDLLEERLCERFPEDYDIQTVEVVWKYSNALYFRDCRAPFSRYLSGKSTTADIWPGKAER
jgi:hypothetical protein